jgi:signal transduction histidine kinase/ActR/RegA family two-component response regulator
VGLEELMADESPGFLDMLANKNEAVHPDDRRATLDAYERAKRDGGPMQAEFRLNRSDREVWVSGTFADYRDDAGRRATRLGVLVDITHRKEIEHALEVARTEAEAANQAKSDFLATVSHEIRTPLNGVLGMTQAMAADQLSDVQRERLEIVQRSGEGLLAILNDLLDLSKIEAGKLELEEIEFDLGEMVRSAMSTFMALANDKGVGFELDMAEAEGVYRGDPVRVRQVIYNLVSNALKFTQVGQISVSVRRELDQLLVEVADSGIGMSEAALARLFSKFSQADRSTSRNYGGTGLGLAICKQLVELMGGSIAVQSELGGGTSFKVRLALPYVGAPQVIASPSPHTATSNTLAIRVLAAEDNGVNRLVLKTLLRQIGVEPVVVENGELAVQAWEAQDWDVILMDAQMPVTDGLAATREIRRREAASGRLRVPIIALTANVMSHQIAEYAACGMDDHVSKPIDARLLFEALQRTLDRTAEHDHAPTMRIG